MNVSRKSEYLALSNTYLLRHLHRTPRSTWHRPWVEHDSGVLGVRIELWHFTRGNLGRARSCDPGEQRRRLVPGVYHLLTILSRFK